MRNALTCSQLAWYSCRCRVSASPKLRLLITLDQAIDLALAHNHALKATRTMILQNQAQEITANLRPNPTFGFDSQFIPIFSPSDFSLDNLNLTQQFDVGLSYLFERGHKRQRRLQAARDQTAVTRAQVTDAERTLAFNVGQEFVSVLLAESTPAVRPGRLKRLSEHRRHCAGPIQCRGHQRGRLPQDQASAAAVPDGCFVSPAGEGASDGRSPAVARIRRRARELRSGGRPDLSTAEDRT